MALAMSMVMNPSSRIRHAAKRRIVTDDALRVPSTLHPTARSATAQSSSHLAAALAPATAFTIQPIHFLFINTTLTLPAGWKSVMSDCSKPLPTYLYSFVAGNFQEKTGSYSNRPIRILYRETDPAKVAQLDKIIDYFSQSLKWMEGYTAMRPPFKEYGIAILPDYPFGGMENPGAFQLSDRRVFLEKNASMDDQLKRMELIAHETAHLWFGDIVQLDWFNNLWVKEVFANFMASKITRQQFKRKLPLKRHLDKLDDPQQLLQQQKLKRHQQHQQPQRLSKQRTQIRQKKQ